METDADNNPWKHPFYIIDPFDLNHNPGKQIKFTTEKLFSKYTKFFNTLRVQGKVGEILKA
jgi:hypothetical protein